jgi:hypothetical protein
MTHDHTTTEPDPVVGAPVGFVIVSLGMERAGLETARELAGEDPAYIVRAVYLAMEYERLDTNGQLSGLDKEAIQVCQT